MRIDHLRWVRVGSTNEAKVNATRAVFARVAPRATVEGVRVSSGVGPQPMDLGETIRGAIQRARQTLEVAGPAEFDQDQTLGVGIEAGFVPTPGTRSGVIACQYTAIVDATGRQSLGASPSFEYPPSVVRGIRDGKYAEVREAMRALPGRRSHDQTQGAIGFLSQGLVNRTELTRLGILMALVPWLRAPLYDATPPNAGPPG